MRRPNRVRPGDYRAAPGSPEIFGAIGGFVSGLTGSVTGAGVCQFARQLNTMLNESKKKDDWTHIGLAVDAGVFCYSQSGVNGPWKIPKCRIGSDRLAGDEPYAGQVTEIRAVRGSQPIRPGATRVPTPVGPGGRRPAGPGDFLQGVEPNIVMVRRCPPGGYVLANDGMCYHKDVLPDEFRLNDEKTAPVSYSDAMAIKKGNAAAKRIQRYAERTAKNADALKTPVKIKYRDRKPKGGS